MRINKLFVTFDRQDMSFLKTYGILTATRMVKTHFKNQKVPFIYDTYQLAYELGTTRKKLFELSKNTKNHYKCILLKKKNGENRQLHSPDSALKDIQLMILKRILENIDVSPYATAYIRGKSLKDNALPHVDHKYLLKMDIRNFFGSITYLQVLSSTFHSKRFPVQIGAMLTSLCCLDDTLPQGAPTSPMLSNIVMKNFDDIIGAWCKKRGITYTRYCDDLTFSSDAPLYPVYIKIKSMLKSRGFEVNEDKTKFISNASCQRVTGLTVNEKVSIPRDYKRKLRQEIHYAIKFGLSNSILRMGKSEFITNGAVDTTHYYNHLKGKALYVLQIEPENKWFFDALQPLCDAYYREIRST